MIMPIYDTFSILHLTKSSFSALISLLCCKFSFLCSSVADSNFLCTFIQKFNIIYVVYSTKKRLVLDENCPKFFNMHIFIILVEGGQMPSEKKLINES